MLTTDQITTLLIALGVAIGAVLILVATFALITRLIARRWPGLYEELGPTRRRFRILMLIVGIWIALVIVLPEGFLEFVTVRIFPIVTILAFGWFVGAIVTVVFNRILVRYPIDVDDNRVARRMRTQIIVLRRISMVLLVLIVVSAALFTLPGARAIGASILASAGLVGIIAGVAAQSSLGNVFAGMQLAFSDAIRLDDVVVVEGEFGRVEEITLTYVVVKVWDQRRLVLPSMYFSTTPFENWTRQSSDLMGSVELDLDWRVDVEAMRAELLAIVTESPLWDERVAGITVTEATGGMVRLRPLVSARNASDLWDLRVLVREKLVDWVRREMPEALPVQRIEVAGDSAPQ